MTNLFGPWFSQVSECSVEQNNTNAQIVFEETLSPRQSTKGQNNDYFFLNE